MEVKIELKHKLKIIKELSKIFKEASNEDYLTKYEIDDNKYLSNPALTIGIVPLNNEGLELIKPFIIEDNLHSDQKLTDTSLLKNIKPTDLVYIPYNTQLFFEVIRVFNSFKDKGFDIYTHDGTPAIFKNKYIKVFIAPRG